MESKKALITGVTGQDGSYLCEFLLQKGYEVHGIIRRCSIFNTQRIVHLYSNKANFSSGIFSTTTDKIFLHYGDLTDASCLHRLVNEIKPDEIYNLAAQSHVKTSFEIPDYTLSVDAMGLLHLLEAVRGAGIEKSVRIYQASTSEMYGNSSIAPQNENTPFNPCSPYGAAKVCAHNIANTYRDAYGMFIVCGILFNHESPRRGENFVTRKITRTIARIKLNMLESVSLGNLNSVRDWGHARDYVEAMWMMLQQPKPINYVISTGKSTSVREFARIGFQYIGLNITWKGEDLDEVGIDQNGIVRVRVNPKYFRAKDLEFLQGDSQRANKELGWYPKINLEEIAKEMIDHDIKQVKENPNSHNFY